MSVQAIDPDSPVMYLRGVGPRKAAVLASVGIKSVRDLLWWFPRRYLDRSNVVPINRVFGYQGEVVTVIGRIASIRHVSERRKRVVVALRDATGTMELVFFQGLRYWVDAFEEGELVAASGAVNLFGRRASIVHPDIDRLGDEDSAEFVNTGGIIPVYRSSAELEQVGLNRHGGFRKLLRTALDGCLDAIVDPFDTDFLAKHRLIPLRDALCTIHAPATVDSIPPARRRLAFDEFFSLSLMLAVRKHNHETAVPGIAFREQSPSARVLIEKLPFELTRAQRRVINEIIGDMKLPRPMNRLLQGDVGSGKTIVALLVALVAIDNGYQAAVMAPTEILAAQHFRTLSALVGDMDVGIRLLTGRRREKERRELAAEVASGDVHLLVGTHVLIQEDIEFNRLGLVVIDEQHRFGVRQRAMLRSKGTAPDVLVMTATPIPRTLSMTLYGDLDVSVIDEMPKGRKSVKTAMRFEKDREAVLGFLRSEVAQGSQAYIVLPLIEESEKVDLKAAKEYHALLSEKLLPELRIGLLHGRMKEAEKDEIMTRFIARELDVLVSTTVIEVGVDVPNASLMIIEHADRFGLAQLHQLRGRVGRGERQSYCILMTGEGAYYAKPMGPEGRSGQSPARVRLDTMCSTTDGFRIAEVDLDLRGPGELWGTEQSGFPELKIADLAGDVDILGEARSEAFAIIESDPHLRRKEHVALKSYLGTEFGAKLLDASIG